LTDKDALHALDKLPENDHDLLVVVTYIVSDLARKLDGYVPNQCISHAGELVAIKARLDAMPSVAEIKVKVDDIENTLAHDHVPVERVTNITRSMYALYALCTALSLALSYAFITHVFH
jgi:hypothetical protein